MNTEQQPPLKGLSNNEHDKLLLKIEGLPFGDSQTRVYQKSIEELYAKYNEQLTELSETVTVYREIAKLIQQRQPLTNKRKYLKVRRRQMA
jgi:flagellar capping protein FliD